MYHSISSTCTPRFQRFAVTPESFEAHVRCILDRGFQALTVSDLIEVASGRRGAPLKPVLLTFDDGFADFYESALPILLKYRLAATLYVVSGEIGRASSWLFGVGEGARRMLNWSELREIQRNGIEIGAHTVTHPALDLLPLSLAKQEIEKSKRDIEDGLGARVETFAYPYGYLSPAVRDMVQGAGYLSACAVRYATCTLADDRYMLPRHIALDSWKHDDLVAILDGRPALIQNLYDRARSQGWNALRRSVRFLRQ
jgi:peptidoglycan/xylan/chitin deacetylase (PgdA/CDA1 family)